MIDKTHQDFPKYEKEFWGLVAEEEKELGEVKNPKIRGNDGEYNIIHKKYVLKIKKLQEKYKHLFKNG